MSECKRIPIFALAGNPNCGKTTLFNRLTGSSAEVGNWPGVTVERKVGTARYGTFSAQIVDLPGIYSLAAYTPEEKLAERFLRREKPDLIINVVDACNPERNLYLTTQLLELGIPSVIALTMTDAALRRGDTIHPDLLASLLVTSVIPVHASRGKGLDELLQAGKKALEKPPEHRRIVPAAGGSDPDCAQAEARYRFIESVTSRTFRRGSRDASRITEKIDRFATGRISAIPLFLLIVCLIFLLTFGTVGAWLVGLTGVLIDACSAGTGSLLTAAGISPWVHSLIVDGVLTGLGAVLRFLPQILLLFLLLSLLEDSGYMARAAFIMDAPMRRIGLSGRSFVPLLMGFGCTVPAVMGARILENEKDRRLTILITPFLSCSAKLPVYLLFASVFFAGKEPLVLMLLYLLGVLAGLFSAILFKSSILKGEPAPFLMELPDYRMPSAENIRRHVGRRMKDFLQRAGTAVFAATVLIWFLQSVTPSLQTAADSSLSLLAALGKQIAPIFTPCGFGFWQPAVALLSGLVAKESIAGAFGVLSVGNASTGLAHIFTPLSAFSFLIFTLLYTPCTAALAAIRREAGLKACLFSAFWQFAAAWYASAMFYQCAVLFGHFFP